MIRQQPLQSRVCGVGEKGNHGNASLDFLLTDLPPLRHYFCKVDRRPIDPPLIVELTMISSSSR